MASRSETRTVTINSEEPVTVYVCDNCGNEIGVDPDLSYGGRSLAQPSGGARFRVGIAGPDKPFAQVYDFCSKACIAVWAQETADA